MAIIYTYPEINQVEGEDLLLISDTSLYKRPTRSVTIDNLAAYVGTVIGIGFWNLGTAPDSIFTTKMASVGQDANIASSKLNVYKTDDMTASVPHIATFNESSSNHSLNLWPSPGDNAADIYGSVSRGTFTGSGTVDQIIGSNPIGRHSGSGSVNFIQGTQAAASLTGSGSVKTIVASYAKTFIEGTGNNNIANAFGAWNVAELNGLNDVDNIYGTYSNVVLKNGDVNDNAVGHFIDFDQVSANTDINNAYYIHAKNDSLSVTGEKFFIKDETGIPSQFSNKLVLNAYGSGAFTGTATQRLAVDTNGNVIEIPIGSGPVDGSGTANYTARWIDTDTLGIGALYDNGTNVGIGTTSPQRELDVNGGVRVRGPLDLFQSNDNTFAGEDAGNWYNVLGNKNAAFGKNSQKVQVNGSANTSAGYDSMAAAILGNFNTAIGESAMSLNNGGSFNTAIGSGALKDQTAGQGNTAIGFDSLNNKEASNFNTAVGYKSLFNISTGFKNIGIGDDVGLALLTGARNILIGSNANVLNNNDNNSIVIGESAVGVGSNTTVIGNNSISKAILYGNVGIGTTSPSEKLHVVGNVRVTGAYYDSNNSPGTSGQILSSTVTGTGWVGGSGLPGGPYLPLAGGTLSGNLTITKSSAMMKVSEAGGGDIRIVAGGSTGYVGTYNNTSMQILQNGSNAIFIDTSKNIGIGTTSPSDKLHVSAGAIRLDNFYQLRWGGTGTGIYGHSSQGLNFYTDSGTTRLKIENSGNVGIGTTSPAKTLDINGDVYINSNYPSNAAASDLTIGKTTTGDHGLTIVTGASNTAGIFFADNNNNDAGRIRYQHSNNSMRFETNRAEKMRITSDGNVGIGTTSPSTNLEIVTSNPSNGINLTTNTGNLWGVLLNTNSNDFPVGKLALKFGSNETASITARSNEMRIGGSQMNITFYTSSSEKFRVDTNGNVGIGTTSPGAKLSVNGNVKIEGTNSLLFGGSASIPSWAINHNGSDLLIDDQGGNIGSVLFNNDEGVALPRLTTTEINAISLPAQGLMAYNTTLNTICFYNGSSWQKVSHTSM